LITILRKVFCEGYFSVPQVLRPFGSKYLKHTKTVVKNLSNARKAKVQRFFVLGTVLLVVALVIWLIPTIFLGSINGRIDLLRLKDSLTQPEREMLSDLQWSKIWWETIQTTTFNPIATILLAVGIVLIAYGLVTRFV
jgi:hypothetical protein